MSATRLFGGLFRRCLTSGVGLRLSSARLRCGHGRSSGLLPRLPDPGGVGLGLLAAGVRERRLLGANRGPSLSLVGAVGLCLLATRTGQGLFLRVKLRLAGGVRLGLLLGLDLPRIDPGSSGAALIGGAAETGLILAAAEWGALRRRLAIVAAVAAGKRAELPRRSSRPWP